MKQHSETIVMSVGGSLITPDAIDTDFLSRLKHLIETQTAQHDRRFIIIAGGGRTARNYQDAARAVTTTRNEDLDWLGLHATRLNGHLLRTIFRDIAHAQMITNPDDILDIEHEESVVIAAGYRPGSSTDLRAIQIAQRVNAHTVINLSNTDYVYSDNPKENPDAQQIEDIDWEAFRKLLPDSWDPGLSAPFDPVAAKEAQAQAIEVAQINGARLDALEAYLKNEPFVGTRIHS